MISLSGFVGEIPRVTPRLLPDGAAQVAKNCKLLDGSIVPLRYPADVRVLATGNVMFYKLGNVWFEYDKIVDVVNAPIIKDRLYITGDGAPKIVTDASVIYDLAVRAPEAALTAAVTGDPDPTTQSTITYSYTYVTAYDEESAPSPLSNEVVRSPGMEVTLTGFVAPPATRNFDRIRIYRSQTSASGTTALYFIDEKQFPVPTTYVDLPEDTPIQEVISTLYFSPPPDELQGIIALPNGIMAGFVKNKLYFSEPYKPHSWPESYIQTTNFDIVGLGAFGRSIAIMTEGTPYIATGITPDAMAMEKIEVNYPCINKRGIVDLGYAVAYPSNDGLVVISNNGAELVTRNIFTREQWQRFFPKTIIASQYDGRYIFAYNNGTTAETIILDLTGEQTFISRVDLYSPFMYFEVGAGKLYILNGQRVQEWDSLVQPYMQMTWRSKKIVLEGEMNFGASKVESDSAAESASSGTPAISISDATFVIGPFPGTVVNGNAINSAAGPEFEATAYADGVAVRTFADLNVVTRLPGGFLARTWEIEVKGRRQVSAIHMAWSPSEFYVGAR